MEIILFITAERVFGSNESGNFQLVVTDYTQAWPTDEVNLLSGFARQGAEAQSLFAFATDLTDGADYQRFFFVGGSRMSWISDVRSELAK